MKTSHTFAILFWINKSRINNGKTQLFARITLNGKRTNLSLKRKIEVQLWDHRTKKVRGHSYEAREINNYISNTHAKLFSIYQELRHNGKLISAQIIKATYNDESHSSKTLQEILQYHKGKIERTLAIGTIRNFVTTENYINRYLQQEMKTSDINLRQLNYKFISDFEIYLTNYYPTGHYKAMGNNTVMKHLQRLRKIVTLAYHLEWIEKDPFIRWKTHIRKNAEGILERK